MNRAARRSAAASQAELLSILRTLDVDRALARFQRPGLPFPPGPLLPREMTEVGLHKIRSIHPLSRGSADPGSTHEVILMALQLRQDQIQDLGLLLFNKPRHIHGGDPGTGKTPTICVLQRAIWNDHGFGSVWTMPLKLLMKNYQEALDWGQWAKEDVCVVTKPDDIKQGAKLFLMGADMFGICWEQLPLHVNSFFADEWHKMFKGHESGRTQALYEFMRSRAKSDGWFVPMTGTAYDGSPDSLYPIIQILHPTYYGTFDTFKNVHHIVDPWTGKRTGYCNMHALNEIFEQNAIQRTWESIHGVETLEVEIARIPMGERQREVYDEFAEQAVLELEDFFVDGTKPGVAFVRSRQIMEHPNVFPDLRDPEHLPPVDITPGELPAKMTSFIRDCLHFKDKGLPFIAYSAMVPQQKQMVEIARACGLKVGWIGGATSIPQGQKIDLAFQRGELDGIIGSPEVADVGFNWQFSGGKEVQDIVYLSMSYKDTAFFQSYKRACRKSRTTALRLKIYVYVDSIDTHILRLTKRKSVEAALVDKNRKPLPY